MQKYKEFKSFGEVEIPPITDDNLTGNYINSPWEELTKYWTISMFLTNPLSEEPVEKMSENLIF